MRATSFGRRGFGWFRRAIARRVGGPVSEKGSPRAVSRWRLLVVVGAIAIAVGVASSSGAASGAGAVPNLSGVWAITTVFDNVPPTSVYRHGTDTVTFKRTAPNTYTVTVGSGGSTSNVVITGPLRSPCGRAARAPAAPPTASRTRHLAPRRAATFSSRGTSTSRAPTTKPTARSRSTPRTDQPRTCSSAPSRRSGRSAASRSDDRLAGRREAPTVPADHPRPAGSDDDGEVSGFGEPNRVARARGDPA